VGIPVNPLHRAGLKQPVHRSDGQIGHLVLIATDASPLSKFGHIPLSALATTSQPSPAMIIWAEWTSASASLM